MIPYASNTGTRRNLDALRIAGWRVLLTPINGTRPAGLRYALDNGAWSCFQQGLPFDAVRFQRLVDRHGHEADWVVLPDLVCEGERSLEFSLSWLPRLCGLPLLLAVQNGMTPAMVQPILETRPHVGLFLGGDTEWKLATMPNWGALASALRRPFHVGRVNSARRIRLCEEAGATSFDGTSASRYSNTLPLLDAARLQRNLFNPKGTGQNASDPTCNAQHKDGP